MGVYILTTATVQCIGFLISRLVDLQFPDFSVMAFLVMFLAAFAIAWPIAVFITEWIIVRSGRIVRAAGSAHDLTPGRAPHAAPQSTSNRTRTARHEAARSFARQPCDTAGTHGGSTR